MNRRVSFEIYGKNFLPKKVNFEFTDLTTPGQTITIGRRDPQKATWGSASFDIPQREIARKPFKYIADTFVPLIDELVQNGAEEWHIRIERIYYGQCNEQLDYEEMVEILKLKCSVAYTAYNVETEQEENIGFTIS